MPTPILGNIAAAVGGGAPGTPSASGGGVMRPQIPGAPVGAARPAAPALKQSPQQALSSLSPQATQALRSIPKGTWQQLSSAGLIHPALMQHIGG